MIGTDLDDYRKVRSRLTRGNYAEDVSVNDVVLATISGAFRSWLLTRGEPVHSGTTVRAMVPVSVYDGDQRTRLGSGLKACFVDLPVGEPGASMRLHQIAFAMRQQMEGGQAVGAESIAGLAGFAPPTLHSLGARLGSAVSRRLFNVVITNVPGPQHALYAGDAKMLSTYPVMPLAKGQALSIGLTSYDGGVYYGLNADRTPCRTSTSSDRASSTRSASCSRARAPRGERPARPPAPWPGPRRRWRAGRCVDGGSAQGARGRAGHGRPRLRPVRRHVGRLRAHRDAGLRGVGPGPAGPPARGGHRRGAARRLQVRLRDGHRRRQAAAAAGGAGLARAAARQRPPAAPAAAHGGALGDRPGGAGSIEAVGALVSWVAKDAWAPREGVCVVALDFDSGQRVAFGRPRPPRCRSPRQSWPPAPSRGGTSRAPRRAPLHRRRGVVVDKPRPHGRAGSRRGVRPRPAGQLRQGRAAALAHPGGAAVAQPRHPALPARAGPRAPRRGPRDGAGAERGGSRGARVQPHGCQQAPSRHRDVPANIGTGTARPGALPDRTTFEDVG